jgi:hypothetical protein
LVRLHQIREFCCKCGAAVHFLPFFRNQFKQEATLRDDYLYQAQKVITDPMILINVVSRRAKQLKSGYKPLVESL